MVRELRIALSISLGTVAVGGCLSSLDERDLENRNNGGTAGAASAGTSGTGGAAGSSGGAGGAGGSSAAGGAAGSTGKGGSAGSDSDAGHGGSAGDDTTGTGAISGSGGTENASGAGGSSGGTDSGGQGGNDTAAGGSDNTSGTGGDGGTAGSTGGSSGTAGSAGAAAGNGGSAGTTTLPPIENGDPGFASRYWDCCKPTCAWSANVPEGTAAQSCSRTDEGIAESTQNACAGGAAYACHSLAPWAVNDQLAYGYVSSSTECGRCYELQFTGAGRFNENDAGSVAVRDRHMFVQVVQRSDVQLGQFDLLIPGGGTGQFNACSSQLGVNASELGAQYGGIATTCTTQNSDLAARKSCVRAACADVFADFPELRGGCDWFIDWLSLADNPNLVFREIDCPAELLDRSGLDAGF